MRTEWAAHYLDGRTAARRPATVRLLPSGLEIAVEGGPARWWPYAEVRQTQGDYAGAPVRLERGPEPAEAVVVPDSEFLTAMRRLGPERTTHLHDPRGRGRRRRLTILAGVAAVALAAALYLWGIPAAADLVAARVPAAWESRLGRTVVAHLAPPERRCRDADRQRVLEGILAMLTAPGAGRGYAWELIVLDDPAVNAFAAPGGPVVLLRGLLEQTETAEELAGVLAHEAQHILQRHATRALVREASTGLLVAAVTGDLGGLAAFGLEGARALGALRYSRLAEEEADREGLALLAAVGIDPAGMLRFFESLARHGGDERAGGLGYLSSHPSTAERIARLRAQAAGLTVRAHPLLPDRDWREVRALCGPAR